MAGHFDADKITLLIQLHVVAGTILKVLDISFLYVLTKIRDNHYCILWTTFNILHRIRYFLVMTI